MKTSEKLFKNGGYHKQERYSGESFVDTDSNFTIFFHNNKLIQILNENDYIVELIPEEVEAMYKYCKEKKWLK